MTVISQNQLLCIGLNHRTAPFELRERLALSVEAVRLCLSTHTARETVREWAFLLTCGRLELYAYLTEAIDTPEVVLTSLLAEASGCKPQTLLAHSYHYTGQSTVRHLCRVAAGLDSLVLGEAQILGQVNAAGATAAANGTAGPILKMLFQTAVHTGKRARAETAIGQNPASISSIAIALAQEIAGDLRQRNVLVVGLGEMGQLALKALQVRRIHRISLANRTRLRAEAVAGQWGYSVYDLTNLPEAITHADVVISAVETEGPLINTQQIAEIVSIRKGRTLVLVDLSMPRSISKTTKQIPNVHLVDLDHLRGNLDDALAARQREVPAVEAIVEQAVETFTSNIEALVVEPLISSLRQRAEAIRQEELARVLHYLGDVDDATFNHIQHLSRSLVNKLLHEPTVRLRQRAGETQTREYAAVVRDLFALEAEG